MRLYIYLLSISHFNGKNQPRSFSQKDFSVNKIHETLKMHPDTIKKYWKLLEDNKLIKYEGPQHYAENWNKEFIARKKDGSTYYMIPKKNPYRIMPRETLDKIQYKYLVTENELKIYLLLAELQERFCYMQSIDRVFTISDLRDLLKLSKQMKNNKMIINALIWLKMLGLVEYTIDVRKNNLGEDINVFTLVNVNYYTNGGEANKYLHSEGEVISQEIKDSIMNKPIMEIEEGGSWQEYVK